MNHFQESSVIPPEQFDQTQPSSSQIRIPPQESIACDTFDQLRMIKSIHVISHLPVQVFDHSMNLRHSYVSDRVWLLPYDFRKYCGNAPVDSFLFSGILEEVFIRYPYPDGTLIIGPLSTVKLTPETIQTRVQKLISNKKVHSQMMQYLSLLPVFSLGDVRDFLIHLNFLFHNDAKCPYSHKLHELVDKNRISLETEKLTNSSLRMFQSDYYTYTYENRLLDLVQKGDTKQLRQLLSGTSSSVVPSNASTPIRSEKNYTIIVLEKLSEYAIQQGHEVSEIYQLRDFYIRKLEEKRELLDVLYIRDCAIIHFTELMHNFINAGYSPLVKAVIQYISLNLYGPLKVRDIVREFYMSESSLRSKFKKETGLNVIEYIHKRKINESKLLLRSGLAPIDVSTALNYYDYAHFQRTFKKYVGCSPKDFQKNNSINLWEPQHKREQPDLSK